MKKLLTIILALTLVFALAVPAAAVDITKQNVTLSYSERKIVLDGKLLDPVDSDGVQVEPFTISGTTYLPLRALAGALGLFVAWDDATSTVSMVYNGEVKNGSGSPLLTTSTVPTSVAYRGIRLVINGVEVVPKDSDGVVVNPFIYNGSTYLPIRAICDALGLDLVWDGDTHTIYLTSKEKSTTIDGKGRWLMTSARVIDDNGMYEEVDTTYEYLASGLPQCCYISGLETGNGRVKFNTDVKQQISKAFLTTGGYINYYYDGPSGKMQEMNVYSDPASGTYEHVTWRFGTDGRVSQELYSVNSTADDSYERVRTTHSFSGGLCVGEKLYAETDVESVLWYSNVNKVTKDASGRVASIDVALKLEEAEMGDLGIVSESTSVTYNDAAREMTLRTTTTATNGDYSAVKRVITYDEYGNIVKVQQGEVTYLYTYAYFPGTTDLHINTIVEEGINLDLSAMDCVLRTVLEYSPYKK